MLTQANDQDFLSWRKLSEKKTNFLLAVQQKRSKYRKDLYLKTNHSMIPTQKSYSHAKVTKQCTNRSAEFISVDFGQIYAKKFPINAFENG